MVDTKLNRQQSRKNSYFSTAACAGCKWGIMYYLFGLKSPSMLFFFSFFFFKPAYSDFACFLYIFAFFAVRVTFEM